MLAAIAAAIGGGDLVRLNASYVFLQNTGTTPRTCGLRLATTGAVEQDRDGSYSDVDVWLVPASSASLYDARMTTVSGTLATGTAGTWQNLASAREWGISRTLGGSTGYDGTLEIRLASSGVVVATASVSLTVEI